NVRVGPRLRVSGLSRPSAASVNSVPGDSLIRASPIEWAATYSARFRISDGPSAVKIAEASCGHRIKKNSHRPSAQSADVAVERKITENSSETASQTPP